MSSSPKRIGKKKGPGRPATNSTPVLVRLSPAQINGVDAWILRQTGQGLSRPQAIRRLVELGLKAK